MLLNNFFRLFCNTFDIVTFQNFQNDCQRDTLVFGSCMWSVIRDEGLPCQYDRRPFANGCTTWEKPVLLFAVILWNRKMNDQVWNRKVVGGDALVAAVSKDGIEQKNQMFIKSTLLVLRRKIDLFVNSSILSDHVLMSNVWESLRDNQCESVSNKECKWMIKEVQCVEKSSVWVEKLRVWEIEPVRWNSGK